MKNAQYTLNDRHEFSTLSEAVQAAHESGKKPCHKGAAMIVRDRNGDIVYVTRL